MSALWTQIFLSFLFCSAICGLESSGVQWKNVGESITIQCRSSEADMDAAGLTKGLNKDTEIAFKYKNSPKITIAPPFRNRLQLGSEFPNMDFLLSNLTSADTGPYWCEYQKIDSKSPTGLKNVAGTGSVLLVVTDNTVQTGKSVTPGDCEQPNNSLVVTSVVISAAVLLGLILVIVAFIKTKALCSTSKPTPVPHNDVYEDMRGTIRR
ncbi:uncharacterized protein LOC115424450 isoform X2 [Sphaeramia orbicularis]|uniref:uncharacterized protein LOC115424450 isoform X2 n=1 Tax=Sphaeramia orbicularis TaxID=375764 RepID=UPI00117F540A|nr:uncharacterized protein LOC115424450 isoform X2 [Sphaeramia orbicularis]